MRNLWNYYLIRIHASYVELLYPHQQCHHLSTLHGLGASDERKITTTRRGCTAPRWAVAGEFGEKGPNWKVLFGLGKLWKNYGQLLLLWLLVQLMFHWLLMSAHSIWPNHTLKDRKWCLYILHRIQFFFVDWIVFLIFGDYFFGLVLQRRLCSRHTLQFLSSICVNGPKTLHLEDCHVSAIPLLVKQMCFLLQ